MPANQKVVYTQGVPVAADFNASDGPPLCVDQTTGLAYYITSGGTVTLLGLQTVTTGIAAAGTTQGTATALTASLNYVSSVSAGTGVVLAGTVGTSQSVYNGGLNPLKVYPPTGAAINQLTVNAAMNLPVNTACRFDVFSSTVIIGNLSA